MSKKIRVVIAGVGNCCKSLIEGCYYYSKNPDEEVLGVMSPSIAGYKISDIEFVGAIDVDRRKVGRALFEAIYAEPNNAMDILSSESVTPYEYSDKEMLCMSQGPTVVRGPVLDGVAPHMEDKSNHVYFDVDHEQPFIDVQGYLKEVRADILVNYLPVGSEQAVQHYARSAIDAKVGFVNMMPVFIASNPAWAKQFKDAGLPIIGDDIKAQGGATILHRVLTRTLEDRGYRVQTTSQQNLGGNTDFMNMVDNNRLKSKKASKTGAVTSQMNTPLDDYHVSVGPSGFVPYYKDNKICYIEINANGWGGAPLTIDAKLSVQDSPNSAGIGVDAIRFCKVALDQGFSGELRGPSAYLMKTPPQQLRDDEAYEICQGIANEDKPVW